MLRGLRQQLEEKEGEEEEEGGEGRRKLFKGMVL